MQKTDFALTALAILAIRVRNNFRERGKKVLEKRGKGMVLLENVGYCFLGESESVRGKVKGWVSVRSGSCEYDDIFSNSVSVF